jgi:hypothetical protein
MDTYSQVRCNFAKPTLSNNSTKLNMKLTLRLTGALFMTTLFLNAQTVLRINPNIDLPKDSIESSLLTTTLTDFLIAAQKPNKDNKWVLETEKAETFILLDEINGIEKSGRFKDDFFYKPYLTNVIPLKNNQFYIQVSYIGTNENTPLLRASFEFIAHKNNNSFVFSSPLLKNTQHWKVQKIGNNIFHYQNTINKSKTQEFDELASIYDKKLKVVDKITEFYCCENFTELQKLIGVQYKTDYNGRTQSVFSASFGNKKLIVLGNNNAEFNEFDPHDLWHDRLSLVIARSAVNKPVDEGCSYLYGGSWGISWKDIFKQFKEDIASNKNINWMDIKENPVYFKTKGFNNAADYIVNALLVQKIEKEKGFAGVWELMNCGKFEKGNEAYYKALEKQTGITKANYNEKIWELIRNEK